MAKTAKSSVIPPVIVLAGEELFLRIQELAEIQREIFGDEDPGMGLVRLETTSMAVVLDEARTASMFNPKKLVVVDPADPLFKKAEAEDEGGKLSNREILENYIESPAEGATLVLVCTNWLKTTRIHKMLEKQGAVRRCDPIKESQVIPWIVQRTREVYDKVIDSVAAARLAGLIGPDLQRLDNELAKLSLYEPETPSITSKAVDALVGFQHEQQIWDMINALAAGDAATALKKVDELWALDPKVEYTASGAVFSWVNQVLKARELVDRRMPDVAIGKELRLWPPERGQKVIALARRWGLKGAARWSREMLQMDMANKSSLGEPRRNLEKFIVQLCFA